MLEELTRGSASEIAETRMHRAAVLAALGALPVAGFFTVAWTAHIASLDADPACGLILAAAAAILFPAAAIAFGAGLVLSVAAISEHREVATFRNAVVLLVNTAGASVFGIFLFGMFFGRFLI